MEKDFELSPYNKSTVLVIMFVLSHSKIKILQINKMANKILFIAMTINVLK